MPKEIKKPGAGATNLTAALAEAQSIIEAAEKRAEELTSKIDKAYEDSQERGYRDGYEQGQSDAAMAAVRLIEESALVADTLAEEAAKLALAISSSVIGEHIKTSPEIVKRTAFRALQESIIGDLAIVVVHPDDKKILESAAEELKRLANGVSVTIETDHNISHGGCKVKTDFGEVDATISSLLEATAKRLGIKK